MKHNDKKLLKVMAIFLTTLISIPATASTAIDFTRFSKDIQEIVERAVIENATGTEKNIYELKYAAANGDVDKIKSLIENKQINIKRKEKKEAEAAFVKAAEKGHINVIVYLLRQGVNVNAKNDEGDTALMEAAEEGNLNIVKYLVENHANVNARDKENEETALMEAAEEGHFDIVKYLVEHKANIRTKGKNGITAITIAAGHGHADIAEYLSKKVNGRGLVEK